MSAIHAQSSPTSLSSRATMRISPFLSLATFPASRNCTLQRFAHATARVGAHALSP